MEETPENARVGVCAIIGLPNVGKSTLLNRLLGLRLVAVSARPQTTRNRVVGVKNLTALEISGGRAVDERELPLGAQIIFIDTPGVQVGKGALRRYMQEQALAAAGDCDVVLMLVDAVERNQQQPDSLREHEAEALGEALSKVAAPVFLGLNKVDRISDKAALLPMLQSYHETGRFAEVVPISGKRGDGIDSLQALIAEHLPVGPKLFPEEMYTDRAERFLASELVREQLFRQLGQELPYATAVVVESFEDRTQRRDIVISAVIYVERESQRGIVIGKGGTRIKEIGQRARGAIGQLLGCTVHLKLHVKVAADWTRKQRGIRDMGYE